MHIASIHFVPHRRRDDHSIETYSSTTDSQLTSRHPVKDRRFSHLFERWSAEQVHLVAVAQRDILAVLDPVRRALAVSDATAASRDRSAIFMGSSWVSSRGCDGPQRCEPASGRLIARPGPVFPGAASLSHAAKYSPRTHARVARVWPTRLHALELGGEPSPGAPTVSRA
jgi:hypothetical protein